MSRKIKTIKPVLNNKSFMAKATPYQLLDEEAQIKDAIVKNERNEKEKKLLEKELEKPFGQRNKAVVAKYTAANPEVLNGYPKDVSSGKLSLTATALDDPDVPMGQRPVPYYRMIVINNEGNVLTYKFPIKKEATNDGEEVFKLDNYDVYIDSNGDILQDMSEEGSPYEVLYNLMNNDNTLAKPYAVKVAEKTYYNFTFPGFLVKYTRDKSGVSTTPPAAKVSDIQQISYYKNKHPPGLFADEQQRKLADVIFSETQTNGVDMPASETIDVPVIVKEMFIGKKKGLVRLYYTHLDSKGRIVADIVSGEGTAVNYLMDNGLNSLEGVKIMKSNLKKPIINRIFEENNLQMIGEHGVRQASQSEKE